MTRRICIPLVVLALLLLECGYHVPPEPTRRAQCDQLDEVVGQVELVASAERGEGGGWLSPKGTKLLFGINRKPYILDVATGQKRGVDVECDSGRRWLTDDLLLMTNQLDCYYIVDIRDFSTTKLEIFPEDEYLKPDGFQEIEPLLVEADQVYALYAFGGSQWKLIAIDESYQYVFTLNGYEFGMTKQEVNDLLARIPHQVVPQQGIWHGERLPSPDGLFYAAYFSGDDPGSNVGIFTQSGDLVAHAHKHNWGLCILGWAYDSSGLFFSAQQGTVDGDVLYPWAPVFKLLAPTPSPGE